MNSLPPWTHFSRPQHGALKAFVLGLFVGLLLGLLPWQKLYARAAALAASLQASKTPVPEAKAEAAARVDLLDLPYGQIVAQPADFVGKQVRWCVDHPAPGVSRRESRDAEPVAWSNEADVPLDPPSSAGRCTKVLAAVEGAGPQGVRLRFVGPQ